jgi:short-subunit dehydrogenase
MAKPKLKPLHEQVIVITGASSGIGLATARIAGKRGAKLALIARNEEVLREICEELNGQGIPAIYVAIDVASREAVERAADIVRRQYGRIDTWVNNAGTGLFSKLEELADEDHRRLFDTNYWGVVYGSLIALNHLRERGGAIVNLGSIVSDMVTPQQAAYSATKHAVKGFTEGLRQEVLQSKAPVSVTLIKPSAIDTPFGVHARNYMDEEGKVPPPAYHPDLVAEAILHAAETPTLTLTVGGAGQMMVWMANLMPALSDRLFTSKTFVNMLKQDRPAPTEDTLYGPVDAHPSTIGQQKIDRRSSMWTQAQMHAPPIGAILGFAALAAIGYLAATWQRGERKPPSAMRSASSDLYRQAEKRLKRAEAKFHTAEKKFARIAGPTQARAEREWRRTAEPVKQRVAGEWQQIAQPIKRWARENLPSLR